MNEFKVVDEVYYKVWFKVGTEVRGKVVMREELINIEILDKLWDRVSAEVEHKVENKIYDAVEDEVEGIIKYNTESLVFNYLHTYTL